MFPEGGAERPPNPPPPTLSPGEDLGFHQHHGRRGRADKRDCEEQLGCPSPRTHLTPCSQAAAPRGWRCGLLKQLCVLGELGRVGVRGWTKTGVKWKSTNAAGAGGGPPLTQQAAFQEPSEKPKALPTSPKVWAARTSLLFWTACSITI